MPDVSAKPLTLIERLHNVPAFHRPDTTNYALITRRDAEASVREWADEALSVEKIAKAIHDAGDAHDPLSHCDGPLPHERRHANAVVALLRRKIGTE